MKLKFNAVSEPDANGEVHYNVSCDEGFNVRDFILFVRTDSACDGRPFYGKIMKESSGGLVNLMTYSTGDLYWGDGRYDGSTAEAKQLYGAISHKKVTGVIAKGSWSHMDYVISVEE